MSVVPDTRVIPVPELLGVLTAMGGSDLHLMAGSPPFVRIHGELVRLDQYPTLPPQTVREMVYAILPQKLRERFEEQLELDTSYSVRGPRASGSTCICNATRSARRSDRSRP